MSEFWTHHRLSITVASGESERTVDLDKPVALLGSHGKCDVTLEGVDARALLLIATKRGLRCVVLTPKSKRAGKLFAVTPEKPVKLGKNSIFAKSVSAKSVSGRIESPTPRDLNDGDLETDSIFAVTWKSKSTRHHVQLSQETPVLVG